jgi:glycine/D-amino acid oxidase-like deaminating enzyme
MMRKNDYDIVVIGGGAQGTAFLSAVYHFIRTQPISHYLKICVIDKK